MQAEKGAGGSGGGPPPQPPAPTHSAQDTPATAAATAAATATAASTVTGAYPSGSSPSKARPPRSENPLRAALRNSVTEKTVLSSQAARGVTGSGSANLLLLRQQQQQQQPTGIEAVAVAAATKLNQSLRVVSSGSDPSGSPKPTAGGAAATASAARKHHVPITDDAIIRPSQWPRTNVRTPHPNDVLCGRGGGTNNHVGNENFRELVNEKKLHYLNSSKREKPMVSRAIVEAVRGQNPPGRFLQKDDRTGLWFDIGDQKAREKTSQALREGAPTIRKVIGHVAHSQADGSAGVGGVGVGGAPVVIGPSGAPVAAPAPGGGGSGAMDGHVTVGHHSPPPQPGSPSRPAAGSAAAELAASGGSGTASSSGRGRFQLPTSASRKGAETSSKSASATGTAATSSSTALSTAAATLQRPRSLRGEQRGLSAPVTSVGHAYSAQPPPPPPAHYGSSGRGGMRGVSVPAPYGGGGSFDGGYYHHHPPHYPGAHAQQPAPPVAAQWVAGGSSGGGGSVGSGVRRPRLASAGSSGSAAGGSPPRNHMADTVDPAVSDDVKRRLLLSEWISSGGIGTDAQLQQRAMDAEADAYRTAGLLGIDPDDIAERLKGGKEDIFTIVESFRKASGSGDEKEVEGGGDKHDGQATLKRRRLNIADWPDSNNSSGEASDTRKRIEDALGGIGAF